MYVGLTVVWKNSCDSPSLATCCDVQVSDPLPVPATGSVTLDPTASERGRSDVNGGVRVHLQGTHVSLGTGKSGWAWSTGQNAIMTRRPLTYEENMLVKKRAIHVPTRFPRAA